MTPIYIVKLGVMTWKTDIGTQKINSLSLVTDGVILVGFSVKNKLGKVWFFEKTFLLADNSREVVLKIPFFTFSNANM